MIKRLLLVAALCLLSGGAFAQCAPLPYTLTNGTIADANQVMANFNAVNTCAQGSLPTEPTNAAMSALLTTNLPNGAVIRLGYTTRGDVPALVYLTENGTCAANSRVNDGGSCVNTTSGDGNSLYASAPAAGMSIMEFGCAGTGSTPDDACWASGLNWTAASGLPLLLDATHKYLVTAGVTLATGYPVIRGTQPPLNPNATTCPSGVIVNTDITPLTVNSPSYEVANVCFQMAGSAGTRTTGAALTVGATNAANSGKGQVHGNTVIFPYNGIVVGGNTTGATQTNTISVWENVVISPSHWGIANGVNSTNASTGASYTNNQITCLAANSNAVGFYLGDGGGYYNGTASGPFGCNFGMQITPGTGQVATIFANGVLGDSSLSRDLVIDSTGGNAEYIQFVNWEGGIVNTTGQSVRVQNTSGSACKVGNISFVGGSTHGANNNSLPLIDLENDVFNIVIDGNMLVADGGGSANVGVKNSTAGCAGLGKVVITNNLITSFNGHLATAIANGSTATAFIETGNIVADNQSGSPITWASASPTAYGMIMNNIGATWEFKGPFLSSTTANSCTGLGSTGTCVISSAASELGGRITLTPGGSGISSGGGVSFPLNIAAPNYMTCQWSVINQSDWDALATIHDTSSTNNLSMTWSNNSVNLSSGHGYLVNYTCQRH